MIKCRIATHECQNIAGTYKESELRCGESGSNREIVWKLLSDAARQVTRNRRFPSELSKEEVEGNIEAYFWSVEFSFFARLTGLFT